MKLSNFSFALIYIINFNLIECAQAAQHSTMPIFTWSSHKKNGSGKELTPDQDFANLNNILSILSTITKESPAQNHWTFASINMPNLKVLKIQKTIPSTCETLLATYMMSISADNNSHMDTSIWGFYPYASNQADIGLKPNTAARISQIFAQHNTQTSSALMPIIHCITTATFTYTPEPLRPVNSLPDTAVTIDNRFVLVNDDGTTK